MTGKVVSAALLALLLTGTTREQTPPEPRDQASPQPAAAHELATIPLSAGTAINASLVSPLDSERSKPGDLVSALVTESVVYQRSVMLPKGSRIVGHVVRTGADVEQGSAIFVEFDKAVLPNGQEALLNAAFRRWLRRILPPPFPPAKTMSGTGSRAFFPLQRSLKPPTPWFCRPPTRRHARAWLPSFPCRRSRADSIPRAASLPTAKARSPNQT